MASPPEGLVSKTHIAMYSIESLVDKYGDYMPVIDPSVPQYTGTFTLPIPWESVEETEGFYRFIQNQHPHPSLCMLFQENRCRMHQQCNQVHADPAMVTVVRDNYRNGGRATCCRYHMDPFCRNDLQFKQSPALVMVTFAGAHLEIPLERTEKTIYLDRLLSQAASSMVPKAFFQMSYVCRLHQKRKCGYSSQCGHVHLCREYWLQLFSIYPWLHYEPDPSNRGMRLDGFPNLYEDGPGGGSMGPNGMDQPYEDGYGSMDLAYEPHGGGGGGEEGWYGEDGLYRGGNSGGGHGYDGNRGAPFSNFGLRGGNGPHPSFGPPDDLMFPQNGGDPGFTITMGGSGNNRMRPRNMAGLMGGNSTSSAMYGGDRGALGGLRGGRYGGGGGGMGMRSDFENEAEPLNFDEYNDGNDGRIRFGGNDRMGGGSEFDYGEMTFGGGGGGGGGRIGGGIDGNAGDFGHRGYFDSVPSDPPLQRQPLPPTSSGEMKGMTVNGRSKTDNQTNGFGIGSIAHDPAFFLDNLDNLEVTEIVVSPDLEVTEVPAALRSAYLPEKLRTGSSLLAGVAVSAPAAPLPPAQPSTSSASIGMEDEASAVTVSLRMMGLL